MAADSGSDCAHASRGREAWLGGPRGVGDLAQGARADGLPAAAARDQYCSGRNASFVTPLFLWDILFSEKKNYEFLVSGFGEILSFF